MSALFLALSLFPLPAACGEDPFEEGLSAVQEGDYETGLKIIQPLAESGHAKAQFELGWMHHGGLGLPADAGEAAKWYRKAAEQGYADAQYNLGVMYARGEGVP